jgi:phage tail-like protein
MPFNTNYLYNHLPARYRRDDKDLFLKRFLQFFGTTLDEWDAIFEGFWQNIDPEAAPLIWIKFWLLQLFGWSWFPWWFTTEDKRRLYSHFAGHLARRGTARGIERWLLDFGIVARVHTRPRPWGEFVWGESQFAMTQPLHIVVEILFLKGAQIEASYWGDGFYGEFFYSEPRPLFSDREIIELVRYVQPHAQEISIFWRSGQQSPQWLPAEIYWERVQW